MKGSFMDWVRLQHDFEEINRNFIERSSWSRHVDSLVPRSDGWRNVGLEGDQVVDWSRWWG